MPDIRDLLEPIRNLHERIRARVLAECEQAALDSLSEIVEEAEGDTIYAIDRITDDLLIDFFENEIAATTPILLIAEGIPGGQIMLPRGPICK